MNFQRIKHKPAPLKEQAELVDNLGQFDFVRAGGVHGLYAVVVGLSEEGVGGVHQKTLALAFAAAMAVSPKLLRVEKT